MRAVTPWRFLSEGPAGPARNMAVDEALLRLSAAPVLRLYGWKPATLSIGAHQEVSKTADAEYLSASGIALVRRPTGGRAVLHEEDEWTYSVTAPLQGHGAGPFAGLSLLECYRTIAEALSEGLRGLGIEAQVVRGGVREPPEERYAPCFSSPARYELLASGRKLVGSAQRRLPGAFLQHGSIPRREREDRLLRAMGRPDFPRGFTASVEGLLRRGVAGGEFEAAIRLGFERVFGAALEPGRLTPEEAQLAERLAVEKYGTDDWNLRRESVVAGEVLA